MTAENVEEGILLTFSNIPSETHNLFIDFQTWENSKEPASPHDIVASYTSIRDIALEQVKQSRTVILPVFDTGQKYTIAAIFQDKNFDDISEWIHSDIIAAEGIHLLNNLTLNLNDTNTGVTLSNEPIFSSDVNYDSDKYSFRVTILIPENGSVGYGGSYNDLSWQFDPEMSVSLIDSGHIESGNYSAYVTFSSNILYNNIIWSVENAKSSIFTISL